MQCNATHRTHYHSRGFTNTDHFGDASIYVHHWTHGWPVQAIAGWLRNGNVAVAPQRAGSVHLFYTLEPPLMLPFEGVEGFDGEVSYRKDALMYVPNWDQYAVQGPPLS